MAYQKRTVLFLCTGNYYRSRYAEMLFNDHDAGRGVPGWRADSSGLRIDVEQKFNIGELSPRLDDAIARRAIHIERYRRMPKTVTAAELDGAGWIVALDETEHRPMIEAMWRPYAMRVRYWNVPDVVPEHERDPLGIIEQRVAALIRKLRRGVAGTT